MILFVPLKRGGEPPRDSAMTVADFAASTRRKIFLPGHERRIMMKLNWKLLNLKNLTSKRLNKRETSIDVWEKMFESK